MIVEFEGNEIEFPDDMPEEERFKALKGLAPIPSSNSIMQGMQAAVPVLGQLSQAAQMAVTRKGDQWQDKLLDVMERADRGEVVPELEDLAGYQHMNQEQRAEARAQHSRATGDIAARREVLREKFTDYKTKATALSAGVPTLQEIVEEPSLEKVGKFAGFHAGSGGVMLGASAAAGIGGTLLGGPVGGAAAVVGLGGLMGTGDIYSEQIEKGVEENPDAALQGAIPYAALDLLGPVGRYFRNISRGTMEQVAKTYFRRLGKEIPVNAVEEFINEAGQEIVKDVAVAGETGEPVVTEKNLWNWANSGVAGVVGGGGASFVSAIPGPKGGDNAGLSPPLTPPTTIIDPNTAPIPPVTKFDQPTVILPSGEQQNLEALAAGIDPTKITAEQLAADKALKAQLDADIKTPVIPEARAAWGATLDAKISEEIGATARQEGNKANYPNPNDATDRWGRIIPWSTNPDLVGKTPDTALPTAGTHILGAYTEDRPEALMVAAAQDMERWRLKHMPGATIILSNEGLAFPTSLGAHSNLSPGVHLIVPAVIRKMKSQGTFNPHTQAAFFVNLTHEFGHALINERFFGDLPTALVQAIRFEASQGVISAGSLAQLPMEKRRVALEYNGAKERIMKGTMTAEEFTTHWAGPSMNGRKFLESLHVAPNAPAMDVINALARHAAGQGKEQGMKKKGFTAVKTEVLESYFNFDEYLAEQTARHAFHREWDKGSPLGNFFQQALASLRKFFIDAKADGTIAAGVAFQEWIDGLSRAEAKAEPVAKTAKNAKMAGRRKKAAAAETAPPATAPPTKKGKATVAETAAAPKKTGKKKVEKAQHNVETETDEQKKVRARAMVAQLLRDKSIEVNSETHKLLNQHIRDNDWEAFTDEIQPHIQKKVQFSLSPEEEADYLVAYRMKVVQQAMRFRVTNTETGQLVAESYDRAWARRAMLARNLASGARKYQISVAIEREDLGPPKIPHRQDIRANRLRREEGVASILSSIEDEKWQVGILEKHLEEVRKGKEQGDLLLHRDLLQLIKASRERLKNLELDLKGSEVKATVLPFERKGDFQFSFDPNHAALGQLTEEQARDPEVMADAQGEWKRLGFRSKYFKAFFGEWENDRLRSSKVMTANQEPVVLYHATKADEVFEVFAKGDIGFHLGTARAAHNRHLGKQGDFTGASRPGSLELSHGMWKDLYTQMAAGDERALARFYERYQGIRMIPMVANIRRPFDMGRELSIFWASPHVALDILQQKGVISTFEVSTAKIEVSELAYAMQTGNRASEDTSYIEFGPVRRLMQAKGFDGIRYINVVEGDVSWVAFEPGQIKNVWGTKTFSKSKDFNLALDNDIQTNEGETAQRMTDAMKPWVKIPGPVRRSFRWLGKVIPKITQIQQLAHLHPDIIPLAMFTRLNIAYNALKSRLMAGAEAVIGLWNHPRLSKASHDRIGRVFLDERAGGEHWWDLQRADDGTWSFVTTERTRLKLAQHGIILGTEQGDGQAAIILAGKQALLEQLNGWETALRRVALHRYGARGHEALVAQLRIISDTVHNIRKVPFFPQGRFGNYILTVEKKNSSGRQEVVHREAFESEGEWEEAVATARARAKPDETVRHFQITDMDVALLALPYDFIDLAASELGLSDEEGPQGQPSQVDRLMAILQPARTENRLSHYDLERLKLTGGDKTPLRAFAAFTWHNANLIAKTQYRAEFGGAIQAMHKMLRESGVEGDVSRSVLYQEMETAMKEARDYIMNPSNELQGIRTAVSLMYLGLNVKTALMNFFGLVTTWSALTSQLGMLRGTTLVAKAVAQALGTIQLFNLNDPRKVGYLSPEVQGAFDKAIKEGVLSQSYAYHLAGAANAGTLWKMPAGNSLERVGRGGIDVAMWLFRLTELSTRRATFLATYQAEAERPTDLTSTQMTSPYEEAVKHTNLLQGDYSLGNRVPWMRGGAFYLGPVAPLATIFMTFVQMMAFHTYGGYQLGQRRAAAVRGDPRSEFGGYTAKIWLVLLLFAGYEGLPGAENLLDLIQAIWRKMGGDKSIRQHLRETVQALEIDWLSPGLAAHGLGHNIPLPTPFGVANVDISRSIGLGQVIPGTDVLAHPREKPEEQIGMLVLDMLGPFGSFLKFATTAILSRKPFSERFDHMPGGLGGIYTAYRWSERGVTTPLGSKITRDLETGEMRDLTAAEIFARGLGFNPTIVSQNREMRFEQYDRKLNWTTRRDMLMDDLFTATNQKDEEGIASARKAIQDYNASIPQEPWTKGLRLNGMDIARSMQIRRRRARDDERGLPPEKRYRGIYKDTERSFSDEPAAP